MHTQNLNAKGKHERECDERVASRTEFTKWTDVKCILQTVCIFKVLSLFRRWIGQSERGSLSVLAKGSV